jgi:CubicO group peptidase (beta-lactamase class C family)
MQSRSRVVYKASLKQFRWTLRAATPYFGYGYQVWILPGEQRSFALLGIRGQMILVDPASKLVMVHAAVRKQPVDRTSSADLIALWLGVVAQLGK